MNNKKGQKSTRMQNGAYSAKECAYLAVFVALLLATQLALAVLPGVEVVTVLFVSYAFVFGAKRGVLAATAFSLLRQLVFGFSPTVLILYLVYFNALAAVFGAVGKRMKVPVVKNLPWLVGLACVCTVCFSLLDNVLTPLWYGYSWRAFQVYFTASLTVMVSQVVCTAVSVTILFFPLLRIFTLINKWLHR
jgi:hypothetical protein